MRRSTVLVTALVILAAWCSFAAEVPLLLNHQGRLLDAADEPVNGNVTIEFRLFDSSSDGTMISSEVKIVTCDDGLFSTELDATALHSSGQNTVWLELVVAGEVLLPRQRLTPTPFALTSVSMSGDVQTSPGTLKIRNPNDWKGWDGFVTSDGVTTIHVDSSPSTGGTSKATTSVTVGGALTIASASSSLELDLDGDGAIEVARKEEAEATQARSSVDLDTDDDGSPDVSIVDSAGPGIGLRAITTKGVPPTKQSDIKNVAKPNQALSEVSTDGNGDGIPDIIAAMETDSDSASFRLNGLPPGVPYEGYLQMSAAGDRVHQTLQGRSGSTTGTIRMAASPPTGQPDVSTTELVLSTDTDGDGIYESLSQFKTTPVRSTGHLSGMSGSTTGTIRMYAGADSGVVGNSIDVDNNGIPDVLASTKTTPVRAGSILSGMSGSTTGTIRMVASSDSAEQELSIVDIPTGVSMKVKEKGNRTKCSSNLRMLSPTDSAEVENSCDLDGARSHLWGMSGSTTGTIRMQATADSAVKHMEVDSDANGIIDVQIGEVCDDDGSSVSMTAGVAVPKFLDYMCKSSSASSSDVRMSMGSSDDTGIVIQCDDETSSMRLNGLPPGTPVIGTIAMDASTSSSVVLIGHDFDGDGTNDRSISSSCDASSSSMTMSSAGAGPGTPPATVTFEVDATGPAIRMHQSGTQVHEIDVDGHLMLDGSGSVSMEMHRDGRIGLGQSADASNPLHHSSGAHLTVGGTWTNASDENLKENFESVDGEKILEKIAELPITEWNYKNEDEDIRHIGPTAQDFKSTFGLGADDKSISTIDPSGIALAAIQELIKKNQELMKANEELAARVKALEKKLK